ncbi:MAG: class I SAM-dependent methyltransferase [Prolixibacteraceae bacterium]|jgi:glycine/sarcosine N-methyltransferase|nr:class I SAM-dependent methyltransferase [Prolixibacteraceae bacterium]
MAFYSSIYRVYDQIFPLNQKQIEFVLDEVKVGSKLLDIGCATGNLAIELAQKGMQIKAFDLDNEMISLAMEKLNSSLVQFRVGNMLNIKTDYSQTEFDGVLCFGNTIVHLTDEKLIGDFFEFVLTVLKDGGKFLFQILNYEYIVEEQISELPLIQNEQIKFIRKYDFLNNGLLSFNTELTIKENNEIVKNQIELLPLSKDRVVELLTQKGFSQIEVFGSFAKNQLTNTSMPLVVKAIK